MLIRITDVPPGEAPEDVRRAWIGIELAIPRRFGIQASVRRVGVLSGPRNVWLAWLWSMLPGNSSTERGYVVSAPHAFERLAEHAPEAERWWKENAPHLYGAMRFLLFHEEVCEPIESERDQSGGRPTGALDQLKQRDREVAWHRELLVNAIRYAAALPKEQEMVVHRQFYDRLSLLHDSLFDPWAEAGVVSECVRAVLTEAEHARVASFVEAVESVEDPPTTEAAEAELERLRPLAIEVCDALGWGGDLSARVFPMP